MEPKKYYIIYRDGVGAGFFSNVFHVLGHVCVAQAKGLIPIVDMERHVTLYNEDHSILGTRNSWEYYFHPLVDDCPPLEDIYDKGNYVMSDGKFHGFIFDLCMSPNNEQFVEIMKQVIKPKRYIMEAVNAYVRENLLSKRILGVHLRGWEMSIATGHAHPPTCEQILERIYYMMSIYPVDKIYLATEQSDYVDMLKAEFGDKLLYYPNYFRTPNKVNAYKLRPYPRDDHMYLLGKEVLVDTIILSRADYLICLGHPQIPNISGSNVATAAIMMNNKNYKHIDFIHNGCNFDGKISPAYRIQAEEAWHERHFLSAAKLYRQYLVRKIKGK
ncbi:MAG: O-fucosyltransferase family protein [Selenomonadaceae bacterium]|nr:O-fucosyltransferase family protein [Selenomonadaceae bacterium]